MENKVKTSYYKNMSNKFDWKIIFENYDSDLLSIVDPEDLSPESRHELIEGILKDYQVSVLTEDVQATKKYQQILSELVKFFGH